jgi:hypothetical protein
MFLKQEFYVNRDGIRNILQSRGRVKKRLVFPKTKAGGLHLGILDYIYGYGRRLGEVV